MDDDNVATSSIVHLKRTVDIENYKALVSDSESDSESDLRPIRPPEEKALLLTKTPSATDEEAAPASGEPPDGERGNSGLETDVNWNVIPETRNERCLVDHDASAVGEAAGPEAAGQAKSANSEAAKAGCVLDDGKPKSGEVPLPRDSKAKKAKHERLSTGSLDASGGKETRNGDQYNLRLFSCPNMSQQRCFLN